MTAALRLELRGAGGEPIDLWRTINSHGFSYLAPMHLDEAERTLDLTIPGGAGKPRRVRIAADGRRRATVTVFGPTPSAKVAGRILAGVGHVLRLDADLSSFYVKASADSDLAWVTAGAGRMLRSPTVFEDVVKTIATTNCSWALTTKMVNALVSELGEAPSGAADDPLARAFPTPAAMASVPERFYRDVVRAGYRAPYLIELSRSVAIGDVDIEALADPGVAEEEVERRLLALPGVGPYAAAHIMMTLGRHSRLILDSWTRPAYAKIVGKKRVPDAAIERRFRSFGDHAGLAFWLFVTREWGD